MKKEIGFPRDIVHFGAFHKIREPQNCEMWLKAGIKVLGGSEAQLKMRPFSRRLIQNR